MYIFWSVHHGTLLATIVGIGTWCSTSGENPTVAGEICRRTSSRAIGALRGLGGAP